MKKLKFDELSLSKEVQDAIVDMGFVEASPIQSEAIPYILDGRDVIGQAQTGTGKTAAFGIPALEMLDISDKSVHAVVMCPTRELALQVANEIKKLAKYKRGLNVLAIYGGESITNQISALKRGVHIVIGTPGRIMDHLERKTLKFDEVKMVVLDEADEMLNMGFREDIESILSKMPEDRQTIFFSATMPKQILALTKKYQNDPHHVKVVKNELTVASIEQVYFEVKNSQKVEAMSRLIDMHNLQLMLVFCNMKVKVDEVVEELQSLGYKAEGIHGDLRQNQRTQVMSKFRKGGVNILVATDVAARGIDVENVDGVFNYDLPLDPEYYVHRIGRTGRAGKSGKAFTFITGRNEMSRLREIQQYTKVKVQRGDVPTPKEMADFRKVKFLEKLKEEAEKGGLEKFEKMIEFYMHEGITLHNLAAILLKLNFGAEEKKFKSSTEKIGFSDRNERGSRSERGDRGERRDRGDRNDRFERAERGERKDRGERAERAPRKRISSHGNGEMVRLFINLGKKDRVGPGDIVGALAGETNISGDSIGSIDIYDKFSFVEIPKENVQQVIEGMDNNTIKGHKVSIEIAKD